MRFLPRIALIVPVLVGVSGCFEDQPRLDNFKGYLEMETQKTCQNLCTFVSVSKADGRQMEMMGHKVYEMVANFTLRANQPLKYGTGAMNGWIIVGDLNAWGDRLASKAQPGDVFVIAVRLGFEKYESGWKINQVNPRMF